MGRTDDLECLLAPVVAGQGCVLWGMEFSAQGRRSLLRLYIDAQAGVTLEDCERVSRQVSAVLDVEDRISGAYTLEVSSPGMDRQLFRLEQYADYIGQLISVRLRTPYQGRRRFQGLLSGIENDEVVLRADDAEYLFPFDGIDKARVIPVFGNDDCEESTAKFEER